MNLFLVMAADRFTFGMVCFLAFSPYNLNLVRQVGPGIAFESPVFSKAVSYLSDSICALDSHPAQPNVVSMICVVRSYISLLQF